MGRTRKEKGLRTARSQRRGPRITRAFTAAQEGPADTFVTSKLAEWQDLMKAFMGQEHSPAGLAAKILAELPALPTVLGRYCRDLKAEERGAISKGTREAVMPKDILPI